MSGPHTHSMQALGEEVKEDLGLSGAVAYDVPSSDTV